MGQEPEGWGISASPQKTAETAILGLPLRGGSKHAPALLARTLFNSAIILGKESCELHDNDLLTLSNHHLHFGFVSAQTSYEGRDAN